MEHTAIKEKLKKFADKLIDLSRKNRMINSNFQMKSKVHFRIIDEVPDLLYKNLSKTDMEFIPLPSPDNEPKDENTLKFKKELDIAEITDEEYINAIQKIELERSDSLNEEREKILRRLKDKVRQRLGMPLRLTEKDLSIEEYCKQTGLNPSFELPKPDNNLINNRKWTDNKIQTLMLPETLNKYVDSIYKKSNSSIKETGVNPLFFCFGFLEWAESPNSNQKLYSPILTLQAVFKRKDGKRKLFVGSSENELNINQSLNEKLTKEHGLELPELKFEEEDDFLIEKYLQEVKKEVAEKYNWEVKNQVSFGIYNTQSMPIYKDIQDIIKQDSYKGCLEKILLGKGADSNNSEKYDVDDKQLLKEIPALIESADESQYSAILDVLKGKNIVIKGPPGTGKSQTIVNIIAALISKGKKVLFVAQKQAALNVVKNKLDANGLGDYILDVFSVKANKKNIMESIKHRLKLECPKEVSKKLNQKTEDLYYIKDRLNKYSDLMSREFKNSDRTVHDIIWSYKSNEESEFFTIKNSGFLSEEDIKKRIESLKRLKDVCVKKNLKILKKNPLYRIKKLPFGYENLCFVQDKIRSFPEDSKVKSLLKDEEDILKDNEYLKKTDDSLFSHILVKKWCDIKNKQEKENYLECLKVIFNSDPDNLKNCVKYIEKRKEYEEISKQNNMQKNNIEKFFRLNSSSDPEFIKKAGLILKRKNIFSFFSSEYRMARTLFKKIYIGKQQNFSRSSLLENFYKYLENRPANEKKELDAKEALARFSKKITDQTQVEILKSTLKKENYEKLLTMINHSRTLCFEFKQSWLDSPDSLVSYNSFKQKEKKIISDIEKELSDKDVRIDFSFKNGKNLKCLCHFFEEINNNELKLDDYREILQVQDSLDRDLSFFYKNFVECERNIEYIDSDYNHSIRKMQKDDIETSYSKELSNYSSSVPRWREEIKSLDQEINALYKTRVVEEAYKQKENALDGISPTGKIRDKTEMKLIYHISGLSNPRISLREYFSRACHSITSLKPCTLMSPLSVSQILPANMKYDVLIIDEASQMKPEYSVAGIARADQVVIVGDQKQLPPTDFFQISINEEEEEDDSGESILDMALTVFQFPRDLIWHYRSRHENLIKFSNQEFYKNLMIPCAPDTNNKNKGVKNIYIEKGIYRSRSSSTNSGGFNEKEAEKVICEIKRFMKERPEESLGVVTMNKAQKDFIESRFEMIEDSDVDRYIQSWAQDNEGLNEFFIKNLENVQGDERDVIFISTVYGPDKVSGKVFQRFGPIAGKFGHRRLNVLFTRAKNQVILFTSLKPSDIQVSEKSLEGVRVLKKYLDFSKTGKLSEEIESGPVREIESPFQKWAIEQIESFPGFSADWEIGVKGYRIDIGVKHKDYHGGKYIMAVETDGANYHSIKSARDRDKLRQEILESYGWKFHRIWSTDWLQNPIKVKTELKKALENRYKELGLK